MLTNYTKSLFISGLIFCGLIRPAIAQTQFAGWVGTFQNYKLSKAFGFYFDAQFRSTDQIKKMNALLLRPGINLYLTPRLTGTVGYAFIPQQRFNSGVEGYLPEHRVWEQLMYTHPVRIGAGHSVVHSGTGPSVAHHRAMSTLTHRLRLEQRYLPKHHPEGDQLVRDGHREAHRLRYFFRGIIPLSAQASPAGPGSAADGPVKPAAFNKGFFAAVQNEIFFNLGDRSAVNGKSFDQNRAYLAAGYRLNKQFDMEVGYMNQYISGAGAASTNNHIVQLATYLRL
ncbi:MAG TPA: DUF2490 domain-containing protein [Puia sp.]|nr:DUF2490 domain-containing protein [Puia sp.]